MKSLFNFKGDRKYFAIVFFILILILISGVLTPLLVEHVEKHWPDELTVKINEIEKSATQLYDNKENELISVSDNLKKKLAKTLSPGNVSYGSLIQMINSHEYDSYSVEVLAPNGRIFAWNKKIAIPQEEVFPLSYPLGEVHFYTSDLVVYVTIIQTFNVENDRFYFIVSLPIEKKYELQNRYYHQLSFTKSLSDKFYTQFEITYNPFEQPQNNGRKYSFEILNNKKNKIGMITFIKPALNTSVSSLYYESAQFQSILAALGFFILAFGFRKEFNAIKSRIFRLFIFAAYLAVFRIVIYSVGFPSNILTGPLVNPAYFSSAFAGGLVKSPIEFFLTIIATLIISIMAFRYVLDFMKSRRLKLKKNYFVSIALILPLAAAFLLTMRGLNASIKSVIFDSTLRYFKEPKIIPDFPAMMMNLNVLMLGLAIILLLSVFVLLIISFYPQKNARNFNIFFTALFLVFELSGYFFITKQHLPLITPVFSFIFIMLIFLLCFQICRSKGNIVYNYIYATLIASVITVSLMNHFNSQLEKESLKTTALEINRPNDNLLKFLINETLQNAKKSDDVINAFTRYGTNYDAVAFIIWSHSALQKESINSSINIYDKNRKLLGRFTVGIGENLDTSLNVRDFEGEQFKVFEIDSSENSGKRFFKGIMPIEERENILGYVTASISFDLQTLGGNNIPNFLESKKNIINSIINTRQLKIFEFDDSKLTNVYGNIYPSRDQVKPILNAKFDDNNEAWITISLNGVNYLTYLLKSETNNQNKITSVSLREKQFSWNLFNFFKIFIIHSVFIIILFLFLFSFNLKTFKYSFRTQLLIAFLIISILPVIILAIYNRQIVEQRSSAAIFNELNERSEYIVNHVQTQLQKDKNKNVVEAFENAGRELDISFSVYENTGLIYTSRSQFYDAKLFQQRLNSEVYYSMNYLSYREYLTKEQIEDFVYDSFYKRVIINDKSIIIGVNDAFNKVRLTYSTMDVDVFLFGVYSFAAIIIIILSTLLANKISSPIHRLTKATEAVAHGDLDVELFHKERGELRDLLDRFNLMTRELRKNQAELAELERENAWKEMAKQVAHEIKNPLTPMKLAVQQLVASYKDKSKNFDIIFEKVSTTILNQIENLSLIASEFSRFARMPNFKLEEVEVVNVVNDTANLFVDENIKINVIPSINSAFVEADESQLRRVLINLIRNAIQANATFVSLNITEENGKIGILIQDNGNGIPEKFIDRIFDSNFTTKEKGMGLGLKLAKRFIEGINGKMFLVESSANGTLFKIEIPQKA